jgi:dTMP kinase
MTGAKQGFFLTFEGADGVGKSTQIALLAEYLKQADRQVLTTREPGGTYAGERVRAILLDPMSFMSVRTELLLYLAARAEHVDKVILPALREGQIVLCDRFSDSTLVYQGLARGLGVKEAAELDEFATDGLTPDLTFLLDAPVELIAQRHLERGEPDRIEKEGVALQKIVRAGFLSLAKQAPERVVVVDALPRAPKVEAVIRRHVLGLLRGETRR